MDSNNTCRIFGSNIFNNDIYIKFTNIFKFNIKNNLISDFDDFWNYSILKSELENSNSYYIVVKDNSNIVGFAGLKLILDEAEIMNIVVKKSCRNRGIGSLLMQKLFSICNNLDVSTINLEVNECNVSAINLYKKFGFKNIGLRKNYYKNNDGIVMEYSLNVPTD